MTAACGPGNAELVWNLEAASTLDYMHDAAPAAGAAYDLVLDAVGKRRGSPLRDACRRALTPGGRHVSVDDGTPGFSAADLVHIAELVDAGAVVPVIDRVYPLDRIAEAHRYVEADHKRGSVVVTVG